MLVVIHQPPGTHVALHPLHTVPAHLEEQNQQIKLGYKSYLEQFNQLSKSYGRAMKSWSGLDYCSTITNFIALSSSVLSDDE